MRPRQTPFAAGMAQTAAWYWGMDLESGVPGSPSTSGGFSVADNRIHSCWGLQTGDLTLKNKESFGGLRNRTEVKFPEWCPKLCGSIIPRGGNWYYCGCCYQALESRTSTLLQPLVPPPLPLLSWEQDLTTTSESWGVCCHPCRPKWKLQALPTFSYYPFLNQTSSGGGEHQRVRAQITRWILAARESGNLNSDFNTGRWDSLPADVPKYGKNCSKGDGQLWIWEMSTIAKVWLMLWFQGANSLHEYSHALSRCRPYSWLAASSQ